jgi:hypothetical protein
MINEITISVETVYSMSNLCKQFGMRILILPKYTLSPHDAVLTGVWHEQGIGVTYVCSP